MSSLRAPWLGALIEHASKLLGTRPHTRKELERKLLSLCRRRRRAKRAFLKRQFADAPACEEAVELTMSELDAKGLLNDEAYTIWHTTQRQLYRPRSRIVLRSELYQKGLDQELIASGVDEHYDEVAACEEIARRLVRPRRKPRDYPTLLASLARRGFPYPIARDALNKALAEQEEMTQERS